MNNKMKLPRSLIMNKVLITKLQETQLSNVKGGANRAKTCDNASCYPPSCVMMSCIGTREEKTTTAG
jgi:hypothetical protein